MTVVTKMGTNSPSLNLNCNTTAAVKNLNFSAFMSINQLNLLADRWVTRNGMEPLLPGLNYTQKQLFWVSAANVWCAKYRPKSLKLRVMTGVHAPDMFRVKGPFSNMNEFAQDFNCPIGSPMNRVNKCSVW